MKRVRIGQKEGFQESPERLVAELISEMNRAVMNSSNRWNSRRSHNEGSEEGHNKKIEYSKQHSTMNTFDGKSLNNGGNVGKHEAAFSSTTALISQIRPYSTCDLYPNPYETIKYNDVDVQTTRETFDKAQRKPENMNILEPPIEARPITSPAPEQYNDKMMSWTPFEREDVRFCGERHNSNHLSCQRDLQPRIRYRNGHQERQAYRTEDSPDPKMMKRPPPNNETVAQNQSCGLRDNRPYPCLEKKKGYAVTSHDCHRFTKKPPPPSSSPLPSKSKVQANDLQIVRCRPSRSTVPRAIDVDLSFSYICSDESDISHLPTIPPLSPISFASSMLYKKTYYPSRDAIEKQLSSLPPIDSVFPIAVEEPTSHNNTSTEKRLTPTDQKEDKTTSTTINPTVYTRRTSTAQPSSEDSPSSQSPNRPEKPLRINSQFPSQLQLQKQRQLQKEQKQSQQQIVPQDQFKNQNASNLYHDTIPSPQPLPKGNGVTNGVATRIDAANSRERPTNTLVSSTRDQETDLQKFSLPQIMPESIRSERPQDKNNDGSCGEISSNEESVLEQAVVEVEIYPGVSRVLRGAQETSQASERNFVVDCMCLVCTIECSCIADAEFVICPTCLVVNPLEGTLVNKNNVGTIKRRWGVGLGYIPET